MTNAQQRLLIISPWIRGDVVDADFLAKLERLLRGGVTIYIGFGIKEQPTETPDSRGQAAKEHLSALARQNSTFRFKRLGNTHAKVLIKDGEFAAITSFNWLSFKGDPARTFRDEQGVKIQDCRLVDHKFNELVGRFSET